MRIASFNIESLAPHLTGTAAPLQGLHEALGRPEVLCLQEVRLRPIDRELIAATEAALPGYVAGQALADDPRNATHRGGRIYGVVTFARRALAPAHEHADWDREGRILFTRLPKTRIVIGNVYAVNGTSKPYLDPGSGRVVGDRHLYKRRFIERLGVACALYRKSGDQLVLIGDWNVSRSRLDVHPRLRTEEPHALARRAFNEEFMPSLDLVDVFRELHPDARKYTWFNKRVRKLDAARVDYALVSRSLLSRVRVADIDESPAARHRSDHAPLWIDLGP